MSFFLSLFTLLTFLYNLDYDATTLSIGRHIIDFNYNDDFGVKNGSNDLNLHIVWAPTYLSFFFLFDF